jgi:hypothetical protein
MFTAYVKMCLIDSWLWNFSIAGELSSDKNDTSTFII